MRTRLTILIPLATFAIGLLIFGALSRGPSPAQPQAGRVDDSLPQLRAGAPASERIATLESLVEAGAGGAATRTDLGEAYLQRARETADPAYYARAEKLFTDARAESPRDAGPVIGLGTLALARHDFRAALVLGREARRLDPSGIRPYPVLVDAQVELGRYEAGGRSLQRFIDLKPSLASYARVSYFRELHGDITGAVQAMRLAVSAGGGSAESIAYVQTLLGNLERGRGRSDAARRAYRSALAQVPAYAPAVVGQARLDAERGRLREAAQSLAGVTRTLPLPEYVIAAGEAELALGRRERAEEHFALVEAERRLLGAAGVNTDVEFALFQADHGDRAQAVALGRRAWRAAPSVRSSDALGWALTRAGRPREGLIWARRTLKLGSRDPVFLVHAGLTARAAGDPRLARRWLRASVADNPRFDPLWAPRAHRALRSLEA